MSPPFTYSIFTLIHLYIVESQDAKAEEEKARRVRIEKARESEELVGEQEAETIRMKLLELRLESVDVRY